MPTAALTKIKPVHGLKQREIPDRAIVCSDACCRRRRLPRLVRRPGQISLTFASFIPTTTDARDGASQG
jgi:hypothetical protein